MVREGGRRVTVQQFRCTGKTETVKQLAQYIGLETTDEEMRVVWARWRS